MQITQMAGLRQVALLAILAVSAGCDNVSEDSLPVEDSLSVEDSKSVADSVTPPQELRRVKPLNVVFVSIDDMNDWIEPLGGHPDAQTPNMQRLAEQGMTFTNAHTPSPACNPSRVALSTGQSPLRTGVFANADYPLRKVLPDADTIYQHFMREGYHVAGFGKLIHRDDNRSEPWSEYDRSGGRPRPATLPHHGSEPLVKDIYRFFDWGPSDAPVAEWGEYKATSNALDVINRDLDKPFFIAVGYRLPHLAWFVPQQYHDLYDAQGITMPTVPDDDLADVPPETFEIEANNLRAHQMVLDIEGGWRSAVHSYLAAISFVDSQLGRLLDGLEKSDHRDNTIVVLWSDHGFHIGEKHRWRKFTLWEESTRVPIIIAGPIQAEPIQAEPIQAEPIQAEPIQAEPVRQSDVPVSLLDIYPTLIDLTGINSKPDLDGLSLAPLLANPKATLPREYVLTTTESGRDHSLRGKRWRYSRYRDGGEELYDHSVDQGEFSNLVDDPQHAGVLAELRAILQARLSQYSNDAADP